MYRLFHIAPVSCLYGHGEWATWVHAAVDRLELVSYGGHKKKELWSPYLLHAMHTARFYDIEEIARASHLDLVGRCQISLGQCAAAEVTHGQASPLMEQVLGPKHPEMLTSMSNLASVLDSQGKYEEAEAMNR